jgi:O-antigen/teichoic acid export membrane protein
MIVPIISLSYVQLGAGWFFLHGILLQNKTQYLSVLVLVCALVNIGLNLIFIPMFGAIGAAFSTLIAYIFLNILYIYYSAKLHDLHFEIGRMAYISVVAIGLYIASLFIANSDSIFINIVVKFFILLTYTPIFLFGTFLTPKEKIYIQRLCCKRFKIFSRESGISV